MGVCRSAQRALMVHGCTLDPGGRITAAGWLRALCTFSRWGWSVVGTVLNGATGADNVPARWAYGLDPHEYAPIRWYRRIEHGRQAVQGRHDRPSKDGQREYGDPKRNALHRPP